MTENRRIFMVFTKVCPLKKSLDFFVLPEISLCPRYIASFCRIFGKFFLQLLVGRR